MATGRIAERTAVLFVVAFVVLNPPFVALFDVGMETRVFGIPLLYLFCFAAWAGVIALSAALGRQIRAVRGPKA